MKRWPGIPIFAQLAGALAEQGYLVVRYDKRGVGKSGGRDERATIEDYAGDALSIYTWLKKRKDVDKKRINIAGHSEGGAVAMIAGARQEDLAAMVLIAAPGTQGADLILEQQRHVLGVMNVSEEERKAKIDLQQKIQLAVMTGVGWDGIPEEMRKRADSPWFKSLLEFDPAKWMPRVKQPVLIIQGALDTQVPPHHADKLEALAGQRKKKPPVEVLRLPARESPAGPRRNRRGHGVRDAEGKDDRPGRRREDRGISSARSLVVQPFAFARSASARLAVALAEAVRADSASAPSARSFPTACLRRCGRSR